MKHISLFLSLLISCFAEQKELKLDKNFELTAGFPEVLAQWQSKGKTKLYKKKQFLNDMGTKYGAIALYMQDKDDSIRHPRLIGLISQTINDNLLLELAAKDQIHPQANTVTARLIAINKWADTILVKELSVSDAEIDEFYKNNPAKFTAPATAKKPAHIVALDDRLRQQSHTFLLRQKTTARLMQRLQEYKVKIELKEFYKQAQ